MSTRAPGFAFIHRALVSRILAAPRPSRGATGSSRSASALCGGRYGDAASASLAERGRSPLAALPACRLPECLPESRIVALDDEPFLTARRLFQPRWGAKATLAP